MFRILVAAAAASLMLASMAIAQNNASSAPDWWANMWKERQATAWEMKTMSPEQDLSLGPSDKVRGKRLENSQVFCAKVRAPCRTARAC